MSTILEQNLHELQEKYAFLAEKRVRLLPFQAKDAVENAAPRVPTLQDKHTS